MTYDLAQCGGLDCEPSTLAYSVSNALRVWTTDEPSLLVQAMSSIPPLVVDRVELLSFLSLLPAQFTKAEAKTCALERAGIEEHEFALLWDLVTEDRLVVLSADNRLASIHDFTRDHVFLDMARGRDSLVDDNHLMQGYSQAADDYPSPYLEYSDVTERIEAHHAPDLTSPHLWSSGRYRLSFMIEGTFGQRRSAAPYYDALYGYQQVHLIGKSIPSGGSRHPTEAYFDLGVPSGGVKTGLYHFNVRRSTLDRIGESLRQGTEGIGVVFASVLSRATWRYRDPRSFRALLVDIGHAEGHLSMLADYVGWQYTPNHGPQSVYSKHLHAREKGLRVLGGGELKEVDNGRNRHSS